MSNVSGNAQKTGEEYHFLKVTSSENPSYLKRRQEQSDLESYDPEKDPANTPDGMKTRLKELVLTNIPEWESWEQILLGFEKIRDDSFLEFSTHGLYSDFYEKHPAFPKYKRRITWTLSESGCHWRAAMADRHLTESDFPDAHKAFAFGDPLVTQQGNLWWYHIANVVRLGAKVYVMDPVVNAEQPVELEAWVKALGGENNTLLAICGGLTLNAGQYCYKKDPEKAWDFGYENQIDPDILEKNDTNMYLYREWENLLEQGLEPDTILK